MAERVYTTDLQNELRYKDRRSVQRWCKNNGVRLLSDIGCRKQYVLLNEYENAKCMNYSISNVTSNFLSQYQNERKEIESKYRPQFENEKRVLSILQNLTPTL